MNPVLTRVANSIAIVFVVIAAGFGVGAATEAGILIPAAVPFSLALIALLSRLGRGAELLAWSTLTAGLLAGTYLSTGSAIEYVVFTLYLVLTALGVLKSPVFLAVAWLAHPAWDAVPRTLPGELADLPAACALFDTPIGLYLLWGWRRQRWTALGADRSNRSVAIRLGRTVVAGILAAGATTAVASAPGSGILEWVGLGCAVLLIVGFRVLGREAELIAWSALTGWLGMTYAHTGGVLDAAFFFAYVGIAALGAFASPLWLAGAWLAFVPWSFLPHHAEHMPADFAIATVFYCVPPAAYLAVGAVRRRWRPAGGPAPTHPPAATASPA